jgi:hypothetical protein
LIHYNDENVLDAIKTEVTGWMAGFPLFAG